MAFSGDRNRFVDVVESVGLAELLGHDAFGNTLLHLVAATGDLKMVKLLLRLGLPGDTLNSIGQSAAAVAGDCGNDAVAEYLNRKIQLVQPDPTAVDSETNDPTMEQAAAEDDFQQEYLDAVLNYAIVIGIDALEEPHLLPIAEEGLAAPLPAEWQECDGTFVNIASGLTQSQHPNDDVFRRRVLEARASAKAGEVNTDGAKTDIQSDKAETAVDQQASIDVLSPAESDDASSSAYEEDFEEAAEPSKDGAPMLKNPVLDEDAARVMFLLQERLQLKSRDMERYGRLTQRAATPEFMPKPLQKNSSAYGVRESASPSKERESSGSPVVGYALPTVKLNNSNMSPSNKSEFDRLMRRYMGFSSTQASLSLDDRRQRQRAIKDALKSIHETHNSITSSLRHFLNSKTLDGNAATKQSQSNAAAKQKAPNTHATLPAMHGTTKERAPQLSVSPLQGSSRPPNNPWIHPRKFTMLFNPEHMRPSKAGSKYTQINPRYMDGRPLLSPSVSVPLYPSISPNRMSDDNDPFAYVLDPRRRHKLLAKQMQRSDRPQCASPWSPELKKSGVWDRNGHLDCNAFLFGDKYIHYNRQQVGQMDLDAELKRKGVLNAEEFLWPNPDPYRHIKKRGALGIRSP